VSQASDDLVWPHLKFEEQLLKRFPDIYDRARMVVTAQRLLMPQIIAQEVYNRAARVILSLAITDFDDLLHDCIRGSGRTAMRSARVLVEHTINIATVTGNEELARRYMDHLSLGDVLMADSEFPSLLLDHDRLAPTKHALKTAGRNALPIWHEALAKHGASFRRSWADRNLADRANMHGYKSLYDAYRIASLVTHGSAAGSSGHFWRTSIGTAAYSVGRSPAMVPLALAVGSTAYINGLHHLRTVDSSVETANAVEWVNKFMGEHYRAIWDLTQQFDRKMRAGLESTSAPNGSSFLAFSRGGKRRWYTTVAVDNDHWYRVAENEFSDKLAEHFGSLIETYRDNFGMFNEGGWAAFELPNRVLNIDASRPSIPATAIFPRMLPSENLQEWRVALGVDGDGDVVFDNFMIGRAPDSGSVLDLP